MRTNVAPLRIRPKRRANTIRSSADPVESRAYTRRACAGRLTPAEPLPLQEAGLSGAVGCGASRSHKLPEGELIARMLPEASECASD